MIRVFSSLLILCVSTAIANQCNNYQFSDRINPQQLWSDFIYLASDELQGRKTQTLGAQLARNYIQQRFSQIGLRSFVTSADFLAPFVYSTGFSNIQGVNVLGFVRGHEFPQQFIVVTAHYDHLGKHGGRIFNGADDNASGVAALLSLATAIIDQPPSHSMIFLATDAEEKGLYGAKAFVQKPPVELASIVANLNLDMLSQHRGRNRLYVSGARHYPHFEPVVRGAINNAGLCLVSGHRSLQRGSVASRKQNWRNASDHGAFAKAGIPYLFIGVSDHVYYHSEQDTVDKTRPEFYFAAVDTSLTVLKLMDRIDHTITAR